MKKRYALALVAVVLSVGLACSSARADSYSFGLAPADGSVSGPPGSAIGWGYTITNDSTTNWLVTSGLSSDPFIHGTPNLIFDFPDLAPGANTTVSFDPSTSAGLFELTWDASAPVGLSNNGTFDLSAQWWSGDPLNGGTFLMNAPNTLAPYSATVSSPVPEPSTLLLLFGGFLVGLAMLRVRNQDGPLRE
jgi:hypothetical protein